MVLTVAEYGAGGATKRSHTMTDASAADVLHAWAGELHTQTDVLILRLTGHRHVRSSLADAGPSRKARRTAAGGVGTTAEACAPHELAPLLEPVRRRLTASPDFCAAAVLWVTPIM